MNESWIWFGLFAVVGFDLFLALTIFLDILYGVNF